MMNTEQPEEVELLVFLNEPEPAELVEFRPGSGDGPKCRNLGVSLSFDSLREFVEAGAHASERLKLHTALPLQSLCECREAGTCAFQRLKLRDAPPLGSIQQLGGYSPEMTRPAMRTTHDASSNARLASASV